MNRFIDYWQDYGIVFDDELRHRLYVGAFLRTVRRNDLVLTPLYPRNFWHFILSGTLVAESYKQSPCIRHFLLPFQSFSSTAHLYTDRKSELAITALKSCELFVLHIAELRQLEKQYNAISDILHILKQRQINQLNLHIERLQQTDAYASFCFLQDNMPELINQIPNTYLQRFLGISNGTFYTYQRRYLLDKLRKR